MTLVANVYFNDVGVFGGSANKLLTASALYRNVMIFGLYALFHVLTSLDFFYAYKIIHIYFLQVKQYQTVFLALYKLASFEFIDFSDAFPSCFLAIVVV